MYSARISLLAIALLGLASTGCQNRLYDENVNLHRENRELRAALSERDSKLANSPDPASVQQLQSAIAERDSKINELQSQLRTPAPAAAASDSTPGLAGIEVTRDDKAGTLTVNLPGDVLFAPGSADVKESAKSTLDKIVAAVKKDFPGKKILVDGYSDTDPISKTKGKWEDNLDLSAARARSVEKYIVGKGLDGKIVSARAFGETAPKRSKDASRRVEIVVATR